MHLAMWIQIAGVMVAGSPLIVGEFIARQFSLKQEVARKLVHVLGALASASLVWFFDLPMIAVLGVVFCGVLILVRKYKLVKALYGVERQSYGEVLFPLGVCLAALFADSPVEYVAAMLIVGFADTAASMIGIRFGRHSLYGARPKSIEGSFAFLFVAFLVLAACIHARLIIMLGVSAGLAVTEAYSAKGSDNITVPLVAVLLLNTSI